MVLITQNSSPTSISTVSLLSGNCSPSTINVVLAALDIGLLVIEDLNLNVFGIAFKEVGVQCEVEDGAGDIGRARLHVIVRQPRRLGPWSPEGCLFV
jgi:hypothetical protein